MLAVTYALHIGGEPARPDLLASLQQVEVEDNAKMADMLRLTVGIGITEGGSDWTVLHEHLFPRLADLELRVTLGSAPPKTLLQAHVIETNITFSSEPGRSALEVVAMDPTVKMNLQEKIRAWPDMTDAGIASQIFDEHGLSAVVETTQPTRQEVDTTTIQRGTDIHFLRQLARRNGFECYVESNPSTGLLEGHFHPPRMEEKPQGVLTVGMGEATNVNSFRARYDMLRPTTAVARGLDIESQSEQSARAEAQELTELGSKRTLPPRERRHVLLSQTGLTQTGELQTFTQAVLDRSALSITAEGELNTVAYGGLLGAKRLVEVRGVGQDFSGLYYVERVLHTFSREGYTQRFSLRRNALGLTGDERFTDDPALPSR